MEPKGHGTTCFVPPAQVPLTEFAIPAVAATGGRTFHFTGTTSRTNRGFFFSSPFYFFFSKQDAASVKAGLEM